jgi:hypothetical protein
MLIALYGITGRVGSRIAKEALSRGYSVTGVYHHVGKGPFDSERLLLRPGSVLDPVNVAEIVEGNDAVVSAVGPTAASAPDFLANSVRSLLAGLKMSGVGRLAVVGGAGTLEVAPGHQLLDSPDFRPEWKAIALAHRDALEVLKQEREIAWTYISPAAELEPGERRGHYRTDNDALVVGEDGQSRISMEDYAIALVDELENNRFLKRRMAVGW